MRSHSIVLGLAAMLSLGLSGPALSDEHGALPAICTTGAHHMMDQEEMEQMHGSDHLDSAHREMMQGMDAMHRDMALGMMAADIDVAFVCGMIPHHQGAIDMARAELAHGDDPWVRALAEQIVAAQEREIAEMKAWLAKQPQ